MKHPMGWLEKLILYNGAKGIWCKEEEKKEDPANEQTIKEKKKGILTQ